MKNTLPHFQFNPELAIFNRGEQLVVLFDSASDHDTVRTARSVCLAPDFLSLSFDLEGFDSAVDEGNRRTIEGRIFLLVTGADGQQSRHELASCRFAMLSLAKPDKAGVYPQAGVEQVGQAVRHGMSAALARAMAEHFAGERNEAGAPAPAYPTFAAPPRPARGSRHDAAAPAAAPRSQRRNMLLAIAVPPLVIGGVMLGLSAMSDRATPIEDAVAQQMQEDPRSLEAQVELTKQTLRSMGLDPGKGGDMGCLAPQS